jgi:hypothetical protein
MTDTLPTPARPSGPVARQPRRHLAVTCRPGSTGLGPNLAVGLVDVTEDRLKLRLTGPIPVGQDVEVELCAPGVGRPIKLRGAVLTCRASVDGKTSVAKVQLRHRLTFRELAELTGWHRSPRPRPADTRRPFLFLRLPPAARVAYYPASTRHPSGILVAIINPMTTDQRKRGRPKKPPGDLRSDELRIRLTAGERRALDRAAGGRTSTWARAILLLAAVTDGRPQRAGKGKK